MTDTLIAVLILGLANGALAQVVTFGSIFEPLRTWALDRWALGGEMLECSLCFGLWSATAMSALAVWRGLDAGWIDSGLLWVAGAYAIHGVGLLSGHAYRALLALHD